MAKKKDIEIEFVEASLENTLEEMKNRRDFVKAALKPAEKAKDELEKATATEKVRLQGTKETKAPNLKPYTETLHVKDRRELGKLIKEAKEANRPWTVKRCSEEKLAEGYRYTFFTSINEDKEEKLPEVEMEEPIEIDVSELSPVEGEVEIKDEVKSEEKPEDACDEQAKAVEILKGKLNFHPGEKEGTFVLCLTDKDGKETECVELKDLGEDEITTLNAVFFEPKEFGKEHEEDTKAEDSKESEEEMVELEVEESLNEAKEEEPKLETFDEQMDFLAADEQEAINGYEKVLGLVEDEHVKEQLQHIMDEEIAHKEFLEAVKGDHSLVYSHDDHEEESEEEVVIDEVPDEFVQLELEEPVDELEEDIPGKKLIKTVNSCVDAADLADELDAQDIKYDFAETGLFVNEKDFNRAEAILLNMEDSCELKEGLGFWAAFGEFLNEHGLYISKEDGKYRRIEDDAELSEEEMQKIMDEFHNSSKLGEASSAEKRAFRKGGDDLKDLEFGKALSQIRDPHERAMLLHQHRMEKAGRKMSDRQAAEDTLSRKLDKAENKVQRKFLSMAKAGVQDAPLAEEEHLDEGVKISLDDLTLFKPWGGASDVWELIVSQNKLDALDKALEDMYPEGITASDLNDILWFERDWLSDAIDLKAFTPNDDVIDAEVIEVEEPKTESLEDNDEEWKYKLVIRDYDLYDDSLDDWDEETYYDYYPEEAIHTLVVDECVDCDLYEWQAGEWVEVENFKA